MEGLVFRDWGKDVAVRNDGTSQTSAAAVLDVRSSSFPREHRRSLPFLPVFI